MIHPCKDLEEEEEILRNYLNVLKRYLNRIWILITNLEKI